MKSFPYGTWKTCPGAQESPWAVEARDLWVSYDAREKPALKEAWLRVPKGSRTALVGSNGAGKSTLLKALAGLLSATRGSLDIMGHGAGNCHHRLVYLPQRSDLDWAFPMSVRALIGTGRYVHLGWFRRLGKEDHRRVAEALEALELADLADRQISELSGGQQQRTLLARCLCQEADLLLLDEPLNALDQNSMHIITRVLEDLRQQGKTVITATHDLGRLETDYDGALYLAEGSPVPAPEGSFSGREVGRAAFGPDQIESNTRPCQDAQCPGGCKDA